MEKLVIATRRSQLALWQSEYIKAELLKHYPNMEVRTSRVYYKRR